MTDSPDQRNLAENTAFALGAEMFVMGIRMVTVFVLARQFGTELNGVYVGLLAMLQLLAPAAQWGMSHVGVRAIAHNETMAKVWPRVMTTTLGGAVLGIAAACVLALLLFTVSTLTVVLMGLAQLVGLGVASAATMASEAHKRADVSMLINGAGAVVRLLLLGAFLVFTAGNDLDTWAWFLAAGMLAWAALASTIVVHRFDAEVSFALPTTSDLRNGAGFVFVQASATAQSDIDKVVLNAYNLEADAGVYGPGYRIAEMATIPLLALVKASYGDFFRRGTAAISDAMDYAKKLTAVAVGYGIFAGIALWALAPIVPFILGDAYDESVSVIRWLSFIPLVKGLQYFPANVLTGTDRHMTRSWLVFGTAILNLIANLVFVRDYGWIAAVWSTMLAESVFAVLLWVVVARLVRQESVQD